MSKQDEYWLDKVEGFMAEGMSAENSILKILAEYPELVPKPGECFEEKVLANYDAGLRGVNAFEKAKSDYPIFYQKWLNRLKRGETKDLFPKR